MSGAATDVSAARPLIPGDLGALRLNNFDAIRLGLALAVVWSHCFALWFGTEDFEPVSLLLGGTYNSGNVAVLGFFAISGFLITISYAQSRSSLSYLKRRVQRILPGYLVATTLCSLVVVPAFSSRGFGDLQPTEWLGMLSNILLRNYIIASDAFGGGPVNGALWSIPYEFWCYLGVLGLGLAGLVKRRWTYPAIALAVMAIRVWLDMTGRRPGSGVISDIIGFPYFWFNVLPPFLLGGVAYIWRKQIPRSRWLLGGLIAATLLCAHLPIADPLRTVLTRLAFPPALTYAIFYLAFDQRVRLQHAARYGDFSYGTYLWGFPVQQMLITFCRSWAPFPLFVLFSLGAALGFGIASWQIVERHFLRRAKPREAQPPEDRTALVSPPPAGHLP
jgi:peptidoglycan/LPS O-acetylase OafA/YrhL